MKDKIRIIKLEVLSWQGTDLAVQMGYNNPYLPAKDFSSMEPSQSLSIHLPSQSKHNRDVEWQDTTIFMLHMASLTELRVLK